MYVRDVEGMASRASTSGQEALVAAGRPTWRAGGWWCGSTKSAGCSIAAASGGGGMWK